MLARPARLNAAIAWPFIIGSACFVLGSIPCYADRVGGSVDGVTYFVGSIVFTAAAFGQLVQTQSPDMSGQRGRSDDEPAPLVLTGWLAHDLTTQREDQHVWRPDFDAACFLAGAALMLPAPRRIGHHHPGPLNRTPTTPE